MGKMAKKRQRRGDLPFARNLRKLMEDRGLSQKEICQQTAIKTTTLNDWLGGTTPSDLVAVAELCRVLKVDFQVLLLGSRPEHDYEEKVFMKLFDIEDSHMEFSGVFLIEAKRLSEGEKRSFCPLEIEVFMNKQILALAAIWTLTGCLGGSGGGGMASSDPTPIVDPTPTPVVVVPTPTRYRAVIVIPARR